MYFFCSWVMDWQNDILEKIKILFRGIGQVMFQNNAWSGVLMLAGIACNSLYMAGLALLGTVVSTSTARIAGYSVVRMVEPIEKQSVFFGKRQRPALSAYGIAL